MQTKLLNLLTWVITNILSYVSGAVSTGKQEAIDSAKAYTDTEISDLETRSQEDATSKAATALDDAKTYARAQDALRLQDAKDYADNAASSAQTAAINAAATDATTKATNAKNDAKSYTDAEIITALSTAATDASTKATNAKNEAISSANDYADTAASNAQSAAETYADGLFSNAATYLGQNLTLVPVDLTANVSIQEVITANDKVQNGLNAFQFLVAAPASGRAENEFTVTDTNSETDYRVGHMDLIYFTYNSGTGEYSEVKFADDRATTIAQTAADAVQANIDFNLAQMKLDIAAAVPAITWS